MMAELVDEDSEIIGIYYGEDMKGRGCAEA